MLSALLMAAAIAPTDTTFVFAETRRDMTGDSSEERLVLMASGNPADSLLLTFRIEAKGWVLYTDSFVVDRVIESEGRRYIESDDEWAGYLGFFRDFFADRKFERIGTFIERVPVSTLVPPVHIEIQWQARVRAVESRLLETGLTAKEAKRQAQAEVPWDMAYDTTYALRSWERIVTSDVLVFQYTPGWDRLYSLAWSEELGHFVDVFPCC